MGDGGAKKTGLNYYNTFIETAEDSPADKAEIPHSKGGEKTMPVLQYEMIANNPYTYTQEDILFETFADHKGIPASKRTAERKKFFSKDQACLRSSALGKHYGWGIYFNESGKAALFAVESKEYKRLSADKGIKQVKAMRTKRG